MFIEKILITNIFRNLENGSISWTEVLIFDDGTKKTRYGRTYENGCGLAYWKDYEGYEQCRGTCDFAINAKTKSGIARAIKRLYVGKMYV